MYREILRNGMYFTSLDCAAANGHKKTVQHLLNHGAKIDGGESYTVNYF